MKFFTFIGVFVFFISGCSLTYPIPVTQGQPANYQAVSQKNINVGLFLDTSTQQYVVDSYRNGGHMIFQYGEALSREAPISLRQPFNSVIIVNSQSQDISSLDRVIKLSFGEGTEYVVGMTMVSDQKATIVLNYEVTDNKWKTLATGNVQSTVEHSIGAGKAAVSILSPVFAGTSLWEKGLGEIASECLENALNDLNLQLSKT